jgi:hypothetical protein
MPAAVGMVRPVNRCVKWPCSAGCAGPKGTPKLHPETPVPAAIRRAFSSSESGSGSRRDSKAKGPEGIRIPRPKRRARRPKRACMRGKRWSSSKGFGRSDMVDSRVGFQGWSWRAIRGQGRTALNGPHYSRELVRPLSARTQTRRRCWSW